jgi:ribonucleoside-triphosphate reductase
MFQVVKRDGEETEFALARISDAIIKAFNATDASFTNDVIDLLSLRVTADFQNKVKDNRIAVEDIQDSVERVLEQAGYSEAAKAFILPQVRVST